MASIALKTFFMVWLWLSTVHWCIEDHWPSKYQSKRSKAIENKTSFKRGSAQTSLFLMNLSHLMRSWASGKKFNWLEASNRPLGLGTYANVFNLPAVESQIARFAYKREGSGTWKANLMCWTSLACTQILIFCSAYSWARSSCSYSWTSMTGCSYSLRLAMKATLRPMEISRRSPRDSSWPRWKALRTKVKVARRWEASKSSQSLIGSFS